jgi:hypothetical protein
MDSKDRLKRLLISDDSPVNSSIVDQLDKLDQEESNFDDNPIHSQEDETIMGELIPSIERSELFHKWLKKYTASDEIIPEELQLKEISKPILFIQYKKEINLAMLYFAAYFCKYHKARIVDYHNARKKIKSLFYADINKRLEEYWIGAEEIDNESDQPLIFPLIDQEMHNRIKSMKSMKYYLIPYTLNFKSTNDLHLLQENKSIDEIIDLDLKALASQYHIYIECEDQIEDYATSIYKGYVARTSMIYAILNDNSNVRCYWVAWGGQGGKIFSRLNYPENALRDQILRGSIEIYLSDRISNNLDRPLKFNQLISGDSSLYQIMMKQILDTRKIQRKLLKEKKEYFGPLLFFSYYEETLEYMFKSIGVYSKEQYDRIMKFLGVIPVKIESINRLDDFMIFLKYRMCNIPRGSIIIFELIQDLIKKEYIGPYYNMSKEDYYESIVNEMYEEIVGKYDDENEKEKYLKEELNAQIDRSEFESLDEKNKELILAGIKSKWDHKRSNAVGSYQNQLAARIESYEDNVKNQNYEFFKSNYSKDVFIKIFKTLKFISEFSEKNQSFTFIPIQMNNQFKITTSNIDDQLVEFSRLPGSEEFIKSNRSKNHIEGSRFEILTDIMILKTLHAKLELYKDSWEIIYSEINKSGFVNNYIRLSDRWIVDAWEANLIQEMIRSWR